MKRGTVYILLLLLISFSTACEDEAPDYGIFRIDIVTTQIANNEVTFLRDDGTILISQQKLPVSNFRDGARTYLYYTMDENNASTIVIRSFSNLITHTVNSRTMTHEPTPLHLSSLWNGSHFLNLRYQVTMNNFAHEIALYSDRNTPDNDTLYLTLSFWENATPSFLREYFCCFDIAPVLQEKHKVIRVQAKNDNQHSDQFIIPIIK